MRAMDADPVSGIRYTDLPWADIGIGLLADWDNVRTAATTHFLLVSEAAAGLTVPERLGRLAGAVGEFYNGLDDDDARALDNEWLGLLADLGSCDPDGLRGWLAAFAESTANWWPPGSRLATRGLVNAVVRSSIVEAFHSSRYRVSFFDNQLGTLCANWAAVSLLDPLCGSLDPSSWAVGDGVRHERFATADERFPYGCELLRALGACAFEGLAEQAVKPPHLLQPDSARGWLEAHAGDSRPASRLGEDEIARPPTVRNAWTAPGAAELDELARLEVIGLPTLTRFSRHPIHLAAMLEWSAAQGKVVVTPNVLIAPEMVAFRHPLVPSPSLNLDPGSSQASHEQSWVDERGLSAVHATWLRAASPIVRRVGRNERCPCGSGRKYKQCHGSV